MKVLLTALATGTFTLCAAGVAAPASRGLEGVGDDWTASVSVPNTSWGEQFLPGFTPCRDLKIQVSVVGPAIGPDTEWSLSGEIRALGAPGAMESFVVPPRTGPQAFDIAGVQICEHFNAPVPGPWGEFQVTGTASVPTSTTPTRALPPTTFTIAPLGSDTGGMSYQVISGVNTIRYWVHEVQVAGSQPFFRRTSGGSLVVEQLVAGIWTPIADATHQGDGVFTAAASPPLGSWIRGRYLGSYSVAPSTGAPIQVQAPMPEIPPVAPQPPVVAPPTAPAPTPIVKVTAVSSRSKLKVDVNPNQGSRYWTFQVQRKNPDGTWKALKTYRTLGSSEKRTINLPKGTYRVSVNPKFGYQGALSAEVTLKR